MDICNGTESFITIPTLIACDPYHLPRNCQLVLGAAQIDDLDIAVDVHRKQQQQFLQSLNPSITFSTKDDKECRHLSEVELCKWAAHNTSKSVSTVAYTYRDADINPALRPSERQRIEHVNKEFQNVFLVTKGNLPPPADHPPVHLNFRHNWKHVTVPIPKWGRGASQVLGLWAREQLRSELFERLKSPSASRPHIVRKPPHDEPKDVDITHCDLCICRDYRRPNEQLEKSHPTSANGTDELQKLPGYSLYWESDRYAMYNAFILAPGPSRELLALHTPIGLIQPTRMVFGKLNAGTVACATIPSDLRLLPRNAHARTASYVDDDAQGSHTFDELLLGWRDFLALCLDRSWTLSAKKTRIGYDHCTFFGFYADKHGTRLADKNLDPVRRMIPPTNLPNSATLTVCSFNQKVTFQISHTLPNH